MIPSLEWGACSAHGWQGTPDMFIRVTSLLGLVIASASTASRQPFPGRPILLFCYVMVGLWLAGSILEHAAVDLHCKTTIGLATWIPMLAQPQMWVLFLFQYLRNAHRQPPTLAILLFFLPTLALMAMAISNGSHGLWYGPATTLSEPVAGLPRVRYDYQPLFYVAVAWGHAWIIVAIGLILFGLRRSGRQNRHRWLAFLVLMAAPVVANLMFLVSGWRLYGTDPTSFGFAVSIIIYTWLVNRDHVFTLIPMAHELLFSDLPTPVLVVNTHDQLVEANEAALALAGVRVPMGTAITQFPRIGAALFQNLHGAGNDSLLVLQDPPRYFDVHRRKLGRGDRALGVLVQLHDVTERELANERIRARLAEREAEQSALRDEARRDPLTGLWNRRELEERYEAAMNAGATLCLAIVDLDYFKEVNDRFGHPVGDAVLRDFAALLLASIRDVDSAYRVGGEEFVVLFDGAQVSVPQQRLELLLGQLRGLRLGGMDAATTFSAGVAFLGDAGEPLDVLVGRADEALYVAKQNGRARVQVAPR